MPATGVAQHSQTSIKESPDFNSAEPSRTHEQTFGRKQQIDSSNSKNKEESPLESSNLQSNLNQVEEIDGNGNTLRNAFQQDGGLNIA